MNRSIFIGMGILLVAGCSSQRAGVHSVGVVGVREAVASAESSTRKARGSAIQARLSLAAAVDQTSALLMTATPSQRSLVIPLRASLESVKVELDATLSQLNVTSDALTNSSGRIDSLEAQINAMDRELVKAQEARSREKERGDFWRGAAFKMAILSTALGVWVFRKPIAALMGVPVL